MNIYNKQLIAIYSTLSIALLSVGILSGDFMGFLSLIFTFGIIVGIFILIYKAILFLLNKIYPDNKSRSLGSFTTTTNYSYDGQIK